MSRAIVDFGSEHTFKVDGEVVKPGSLFNGQVVQIHGQRGEYKVVKKEFDKKKKIIIKCEKMPDYQFKTFHKKLKETFGVEAQCRDNEGTNEYLISIKGKKKWVAAIDCSGAEPKPV